MKRKKLVLAGGVVLIFGATIGILLNVMPSPHKSTDYLVMGTIATLLCLVLLFIVLKTTEKDLGKKE